MFRCHVSINENICMTGHPLIDLVYAFHKNSAARYFTNIILPLFLNQPIGSFACISNIYTTKHQRRVRVCASERLYVCVCYVPCRSLFAVCCNYTALIRERNSSSFAQRMYAHICRNHALRGWHAPNTCNRALPENYVCV